MKILLPITNHLDLALSALAALLLHAAIVGFGFGPLERAPMPEINQNLRCETVSMSPRKHHTREPIKKQVRERVENERLAGAVEVENAARTLKRQPARNKSADTKVRKQVNRTVREVLPRERSETPSREKTPEPEEREIKPPEPSGEAETAISRSAAPAVEKGFSFTYPRFARLQGYQGRVTLRVRVAPNGTVITVDIEQSSGYDILDQSALRQMKSVPFLPALDRKGKPIETEVIQSVNFTIKGTASGSLNG